MGWVICDRTTKKIVNGFLRWDHRTVTEAQIEVACDEPPPMNYRWDDATSLRVATAEELAADMDASKDADSKFDSFPAKYKAVFKAFVQVINLRLPAGQKITQAEVETAVKANL